MNDPPVVLTFPVERTRARMAAVTNAPAQAEMFMYERKADAKYALRRGSGDRANDDDASARDGSSGRDGAERYPASRQQIRFTSDMAGRLLRVNAAYHDYTGGRDAAANGTTNFPAIHPCDEAAVGVGWREAVENHESFIADFRLVGSDGESRWFRAHATPAPDVDGMPQGWSGVCVDIEDLKQEQAVLRVNASGLRRSMAKQNAAGLRWRELQTGLADAARLSAVGQMATTLAHELNQPLTAAATYAKAAVRALERMDAGSDSGAADGGAGGGENAELASRAASNAAQQVLRAGEIVRALREFVSTGECRRSRESLRAVVEEATAFALIGVEDLRVAVRITLDETTQVLINRIQIQQVLINIVRNALEAMEASEQRELDVTLHEDSKGVAVVCVADSGPGVPHAFADRLFSPCASAKTGGMGVGLSISRSIVEAHGGRIWAEPAARGGAVFKFTLPMIGPDPYDR